LLRYLILTKNEIKEPKEPDNVESYEKSARSLQKDRDLKKLVRSQIAPNRVFAY